MEKLKYIKIEHPDGTLSDNVPIGVDATNVDVTDEKDLSTKLNELDSNDANYSSAITTLQSTVKSLSSGAPAGVYETASALAAEDPDHNKIYVVTADGHWYYHNGTSWTDGGVYQGIALSEKDINKFHFNEDLRDDIYENIGTKNWFFKQLGVAFSGNVNQGTTYIQSYPQMRSLVFEVEPNTIYTAEETERGNMFRVFTTETYPAAGVYWIQYLHPDGKKLTFTTGANVHYVMFTYYNYNTDTKTEAAIRAGLKFYEGSSFEAPVMKYATHTITKSQVPEGIISYNNTNFAHSEGDGTEDIFNPHGELVHIIGGISGTSAGHFVYFAHNTSIIQECLPNTTYTIAKSLGARLRVESSVEYPAVNVDWTVHQSSDGGSSVTITTGENDRYLTIYFHNAEIDTDVSLEECLNSMHMSIGNVYTESHYYLDKIHTKIESLIDSSIVNLLSYRALGPLEKGYLCLVCDDGAMALSRTTFPILQSKNVPCTFALMHDSAILRETGGDIDGVKNMINNYGCSIAYHGTGQYTQKTPEQLVAFLEGEKAFFESLNLTAKGLCYPWHSHTRTIQMICGGFTDVCAGGWSSNIKAPIYENQLNGPRSNIYELSRTSLVSYGFDNLKAAVDNAIANNRLMIVFWHDSSLEETPEYATLLGDFIDYAKNSGITFTTLGNVPNLK